MQTGLHANWPALSKSDAWASAGLFFNLRASPVMLRTSPVMLRAPLSCCAQSQHPERPVERSEPGLDERLFVYVIKELPDVVCCLIACIVTPGDLLLTLIQASTQIGGALLLDLVLAN